MSIENELWLAAGFSRELRGFRQDLARRWTDTASHKAAMLYLDPHQEESERMVEEFGSQQDCAALATASLDETESGVAMAAEISRRLEGVLELLSQEFHIAEQLLAISIESEVNSRFLAESIDALLDEANCSCNGVPSQ